MKWHRNRQAYSAEDRAARRRMAVTDPQARLARRITWITRFVLLGLTALLVGLFARTAHLHVSPPPQLAPTVGDRLAEAEIKPRRGALLDRQGRALAVSRYGKRLFVDPLLIEDHNRFAVKLGRAIGIDPINIDIRLAQRPDSRYIVIAPLLTDEQVRAVAQLDLPGAALEAVPVRHYPQGEVAGHVVGFVGAEHVGLDGMEFALDSRMDGAPGELAYLRNAYRQPVWVEAGGFKPAANGRDVRLSIDAVVQRIAERHLAEAVSEYDADRGEAVVLHARTGQVLAMANVPLYDPSGGGNVPAEQRRNRTVTDPYEPGSIFKPFVWAAATEADLAGPDEIIDTTETGAWRSRKGRRLRDTRGHGAITWEQVLIESSNIGMAIVGQRMGAATMREAVKRFGFGERTGIALPGESAGIVHPLKQWNHYSVTSVPMGQEIAVTPLQMARAFSVFANGGLMPAPTIRAERTDLPVFERVLDERTADHTRRVLRRVVTEGTGRKVKGGRYRIWGKTGTAQVPGEGGYKPDAYAASFICGAPLRQPEIIVMVVVHEPDAEKGYYGGIVAAPVAKRVVNDVLPYLNVPPDAERAADRTTPRRAAM